VLVIQAGGVGGVARAPDSSKPSDWHFAPSFMQPVDPKWPSKHAIILCSKSDYL
jgi:hypothetical protein